MYILILILNWKSNIVTTDNIVGKSLTAFCLLKCLLMFSKIAQKLDLMSFVECFGCF